MCEKYCIKSPERGSLPQVAGDAWAPALSGNQLPVKGNRTGKGKLTGMAVFIDAWTLER